MDVAALLRGTGLLPLAPSVSNTWRREVVSEARAGPRQGQAGSWGGQRHLPQLPGLILHLVSWRIEDQKTGTWTISYLQGWEEAGTGTCATPALTAPTGHPQGQAARGPLPTAAFAGQCQQWHYPPKSCLHRRRSGSSPAPRVSPKPNAPQQSQHPAPAPGGTSVLGAGGPSSGHSHPAPYAGLVVKAGPSTHRWVPASVPRWMNRGGTSGCRGVCWGPRLEAGRPQRAWCTAARGWGPMAPGMLRWCQSSRSTHATASTSRPSRFGGTGAAACPRVLPATGGAGCCLQPGEPAGGQSPTTSWDLRGAGAAHPRATGPRLPRAGLDVVPLQAPGPG